ncbi:MAG: hypothetical protein J6J01_09405 [Oscillospiraceae bacterium]|nr:hypothetical protein [Oscillospiraceae bacterium]
MINIKYNRLIIGGEDYTDYFTFPFMVQKALDETLDFAVVELPYTRRKEPFAPFTPVEIGRGEHAMSFIVAIDEVEHKIGANRFKHTVTVMEYTKETERILCGAKAFTNPLVRDYADGQTYALGLQVLPLAGNEDFFYFTSTTLQDPIRAGLTASPVVNIGVLSVYADFGIAQMAHAADTYTVDLYYSSKHTLQRETDKDGKETGGFEIVGQKIWSKAVPINTQGLIENVDISAYGEGQYFIMYRPTLNVTPSLYIAAQIQVVRDAVDKPPYTVEDVVKILLDTSETLRVGLDSPRYRLRYKNDRQRETFRKAAPEFRFSNGRSLWECLREVGQYVHAIPRAVHDLTDGLDYIEFDELGGLERADLSKGSRYGGASTVTVGDYTAGLEAMAANLVNLDDEADGSMTEPFGSGYMSLRAATEDVRITEKTGIIKTAHPVEKILKVEVGSFTVGGKTYTGGDITPYIFEKSEYDILSGFSGAYPTSKTYALYYKQGAPNIEGLWYKAQDAGVEALNATEDYSITNVITAVTGAPSGILRGLDYPNLMFRVTYIPSVTARVRAYKPTYDSAFPSVLAHNQSANKLSSRHFGENLRGQLAMMASSSDSMMYMFKRLEDVPKPGTLYDDDNYISSVTARVYHDFVLANITLSTGYNQLGSRVEINNAIRQFEIPASEDRYTVLEEFCEIGTKTADDANIAATVTLQHEVLRAFANQAGGKDVSLAQVTTYDEDGNAITSKPVALPVISLALGTSLYFGWRFEDNFAAGSKSSTGASGYRIQDYVPYGDPFYAQAHSVGFRLVTGATSSNALQTAHNLPESSGISGGTVMADTGAYPILWHKDSADAGCLSYQLHYITNDGLIIGDGIAYHCAAVRQSQMATSAQIYFYGHRINQLTGTTDERDYLATFPIIVDTVNNCLTYVGTPPEGFESWAIIKGGRFMLGKNTRVAPDNIYFNFKRRLKT